MGSGKDRKHRKKGVNLGPKRSSFQKKDKSNKLLKKKNRNSKKKGVNGEKDEVRVRNNENYENGVDMVEEKNVKKEAKRRKSSKNDDLIPFPTASQQLNYFLHQYQSGNGIQLSALELEAYKDEYMLELKDKTSQTSLAEHMKSAFGSSYVEILCQKQLLEGKVDPGNPALLVISSSALRSLELFREFRPLTKECPAVKLFSKHMKIEEQVSFLKNRVNIACGTPNRIKKLIDMGALGLSRLAVVVLDMHTDVKGYSLFTLPQIREEFWDLFKTHFHERLLGGDMRICLYGNIPATVTPLATTEATDD